MSAVLQCSDDQRSERGWRPVGKGDEHLRTWALWSRGHSPGSSSTAGGWSEPLDSAHEDEPPELVIVVDRILAKFGMEHKDHRRAVKAYYIDNRAAWEIAQHMVLTSGYVKLMIQGTCDLVARLYDDYLDSLPKIGKL